MRLTLPVALLLALALAFPAPRLATAGKAAPRLKAGCYRAVAHQAAKANASREEVTDELKFLLMVTAVDESGNVEGEVTLHRETGSVKGRVDGEGVLRVSGVLKHDALRGDRAFELTAKVTGAGLADGRYVKASKIITSKGSFKKATYTVK